MQIEERIARLERENWLHRTWWGFLAFLVVALVAIGAATEVAGRFQLFQASVEFTNLKGETSRSTKLLRIDTATGEVWRHDFVQFKRPDTGEFVQNSSWVPLVECIGGGCQ